MFFPHPIAGVVFDMDGLLFDTERLYAKAMLMAAEAVGASLAPDVIYHTIGLPAADCDEIWIEHFGPDFDVASFWSASATNVKAMAETDLCLKAGVLEMLDLLDRLKLPRAIATSTDRPTVDHHLAKAALSKRFDAIVAYGDYDRGKPHPAPYLVAAERLKINPINCLALEDSHNGVRSAAAAGMITIMVPDLTKPTREMRKLTHRIARDLHEVCGLFE